MSEIRKYPRAPSVASEASECETVFRGVTLENTEKFRHTFTRGRVVKVYDGDTVHIVDEKRQRHLCRLDGIDAPELRTKDPAEKRAGLLAKDLLTRVCFDKIVDVQITGAADTDKYGRVLVVLHRKKYGNLNVFMCDNFLAVPYDGRKKHKVDWAVMVKKYEERNTNPRR